MIQLGVNSVLFWAHDLATAMKHIALAGYDGVELSAIVGVCEHLDLACWKPQVQEIRSLARQYKLKLLSLEAAQRWDEPRLANALEAAAALGIPIVNIGPGGASDDEDSFQRRTDCIARAAKLAEAYGVTLCVKAHTRSCILGTPATLRAMKKIASPAFGIDIDSSHLHRAGAQAHEGLAAALPRVRHIHVRDCTGRGLSPGPAKDQSLGHGEIDLMRFFQTMIAGGYDGPVCLEIIDAAKYELADRAAIAAESYAYMKACMKALGARS